MQRLSDSKTCGVTRANLLRIFVEGALRSHGPLRASALKALNKHLQVFRGHKGEFTARQVKKLLDAAELYMADPNNQIDLTRPRLIRKPEGRAGNSLSSLAKQRKLPF